VIYYLQLANNGISEYGPWRGYEKLMDTLLGWMSQV
jgi:hypothetical protein